MFIPSRHRIDAEALRAWPTFQAGISLIELVMFIMIVSIALAGVLSVMNISAKSSADPMVRKQAISVAESLLEEIEAQPFTWCDPDDANAATAASTADCTTVQGLAPTAGESRYSATAPYDNVGDYNGFSMNPILDLNGNAVATLSGASASVSIVQAGTAFGLGTDADALQIDVRVVRAPDIDITLTGYRFRYAPNATP